MKKFIVHSSLFVVLALCSVSFGPTYKTNIGTDQADTASGYKMNIGADQTDEAAAPPASGGGKVIFIEED